MPQENPLQHEAVSSAENSTSSFVAMHLRSSKDSVLPKDQQEPHEELVADFTDYSAFGVGLPSIVTAWDVTYKFVVVESADLGKVHITGMVLPPRPTELCDVGGCSKAM